MIQKISIPVLSGFMLLFLFVFLPNCDRSKNLKVYDFGGDFTLTDQAGNAFHFKDLRGKTVLLFFGFTLCPDICPATMSKLRKVYELLEKDSDKIQIVFISVDPERDSPEKLKKYLDYFNMGVIGLTGSLADVKSVAEQYHARFAKVTTEQSAAGYLVEHSTSTYLIDRNGKVRYLFRQSENPKLMASIIEILLDDKSSE
ncbi:MAG: SCO family protein [Spirochaetia bacterium]|nr:SCO family protein [Spirochaetia bacterium]